MFRKLKDIEIASTTCLSKKQIKEVINKLKLLYSDNFDAIEQNLELKVMSTFYFRIWSALS